MQRTSLSFPHLLLALAVMAVWGTNFVVMRFALDTLPPLLIAALRFAFVFLPLALFIPRPDVPWRTVAAYGFLVGGLPFGFLLAAMKADISPGLASLLMQSQVFLTIGLAILVNRERVRGYQWAAFALAVAGIALIGAMGGGEATVTGIGLVLLAALSWAVGTIAARTSSRVNMVAFVIWSGVFASVPLFAASWLLEGREAILTGLAAAGPLTWGAVLWQSVGNTLFGYAAYSWLLARYPAASVAPLVLLVPVFGLATSALVLGEGLPGWKLLAAAMIIGGLFINQFWPMLRTAAVTAAARP